MKRKKRLERFWVPIQKTASMDFQSYVNLYRKLGFSVIPLNFKEKTPALSTWKEYQSRKPTDQEIAEWFSEEQVAKGINIGIVCGKVSGGLVGIDFDDPEVYRNFFSNIEKLQNETLVVKSARGFKVYFTSKEPVKSASIPELHMEIRSEARYDVVPPSIHPTGIQYDFANPGLKEIQEVTGLEESLWKRIEELGVRKRVFIDPTWRTGRVGRYKGSHPPCIKGLLEGVEEPGRHEAAIRLFSYFMNFRGEKPKRTYERLKEWNKKNHPPLEEAELQDIFTDVAKGPYNYGCTDSVFRCFCLQDECEVGKNKISGEAIAKAQELMKDPIGFLQFLQETLECRLTGEEKNRIYMFLAGCGASVKTILVKLCGPSSVGKNMLCAWMQEVFGSDRVIIISSATAAWLKRKVLEGLDTRGKIFILLEERGEKQGTLKYHFEQIYSEDKIVLAFNVRSEESGEWEATEVVLQGPLCFVTTSTELEFSVHAETRQSEVYPDDSFEQTQRIDQWYNWRELRPVEALEEEKRQLEVLKAYIGLLKVHRDYRVPYINMIDFKAKRVEDRRRKKDFIGLMKYACHIFQGVLPVDPKTDIVFAMPFVYDFIMMIADEVIYATRGGLTKNENKILQFIKEHPLIYTVTAEGKTPRKGLKEMGKLESLKVLEEPEGFTLRVLTEHPELSDLHEKTIYNALTGLVRKRRLQLLKEGGRGVAAVYGRMLAELSESSKKALLPEISPFSNDFLLSQIRKILYGKSVQELPPDLVPKSLIETCELAKVKMTPETVLFQPKWRDFEPFNNSASSQGT